MKLIQWFKDFVEYQLTDPDIWVVFICGILIGVVLVFLIAYWVS